MPNLLKNNSFILFLFLISGGLISAFLQYEAVWDFINYHYFNAWAFINGRVGYDVLLAGLNSFFNPLADVPLYYMIEYLNDYPRIIYFIQGLWFGALWFVFYKICLMYLDVTTLRDKLVLILCLLIALSGYATFKQIGTSTNEVMLAFLVMSGLYLLLKELFEIKSGNWKTFVLSGFLFGSAMGLKLTAFIYCVVIGFCLIVFYKQVKFPIRNILLFTFSGLIGFLVFDGFWLWKMWQMFENPFFPFANRFFKSSWLSAHNFTDNNFTPKNWSDFALWPLIQSFSFQRDEGKMFVADILNHFISRFFGKRPTDRIALYSQILDAFQKLGIQRFCVFVFDIRKRLDAHTQDFCQTRRTLQIFGRNAFRKLQAGIKQSHHHPCRPSFLRASRYLGNAETLALVAVCSFNFNFFGFSHFSPLKP